MNPAIANYLNQKQNQGQSQGQQPQTSNYNPFDAGISRAISTARQSLGMTPSQSDSALRRSILTAASAFNQQPAQRGFVNNLGAVGRSLMPAIASHDDSEESAINQNNAMANQILAYRAAEEQKLAAEEERSWKRNFMEQEANWKRGMAESQLGETKRYHNLLDNFRKNKNQEAVNSTTEELPASMRENLIPMSSKTERNVYIKEKKSSGEILKELSEIQGAYSKFRESAQEDLIDPMTPYGVGPVANEAKDFWGYFGGNKELQDQTKQRKALESQLGKFNIELERKIKGGVLSESLRKAFENKELLPSLSDRPEVFEEKLNNLKHEVSDRYKSANLSLKYNAHISPYDLEDLSPAEDSTGDSTGQMVRMRDSTGSEYDIPVAEAEAAMNEGLVPIQ